MPAPNITIEWGEKVGSLASNAQTPKAILWATAAILTAGARLSFVEEGRDPEGKWPKRAVPNIAGIFADFSRGRPAPLERRFETGQTLVDTGDLLKSVQDPEEAEVDLNTNEVIVRSKLTYAAKQQKGADDELVGVITEDFQKWLLKFVMKDVRAIRQGFGSEAADVAFAAFEKSMGFLLNPNMIGTEIRIDIPARPFLEITPQDIQEISDMLGVRIIRDPEERV